MSKSTNKISCPQCGNRILEKPKQNFFTTHKTYLCEKCGYKGGLPLKTSTKMFYWTCTIVVVLILIIMGTGGKGSIGLLGIIAPILLYKDWQSSKKLRHYWEEKKFPPIPIPTETHGVLKGIIYSIIIIFVAFGIGSFVYSNQNNVNSNTTNSNSDTWQTFNSVDEGFRINFPSYPKKEVSPVSQVSGITMQSTTYSSDEGNSTYMVVVYGYDIEPRNYNVKNGLEGMVNGFVNGIKGASLINSSFITFGSYQAVDFSVSVPSEHTTFSGRAIVRDDLPTVKAYMILSGSTASTITKHDQFVNSFVFTN